MRVIVGSTFAIFAVLIATVVVGKRRRSLESDRSASDPLSTMAPFKSDHGDGGDGGDKCNCRSGIKWEPTGLTRWYFTDISKNISWKATEIAVASPPLAGVKDELASMYT